MDLSKQADRLAVINSINDNEENKGRKRRSLKEYRIFQNRIRQYVVEKLNSEFDVDTVAEMPIVDSINISRRVVKQQATIYQEAPKRTFTNLSPEQEEVVRLIYRDLKLDQKLLKSNELYKLQYQNLIQILPFEGRLELRVFKQHEYDALPDPAFPERAYGYVISTFDRTGLLNTFSDQSPTGDNGISQSRSPSKSDELNQKIADQDDYKSTLHLYNVWTKEFMEAPALNFVMNSKGVLVTSTDEALNPLGDFLPFVDVAQNKDWTYYVTYENSDTDFTVDWNALWTDVRYITRMQGWSQAVLSGDADLMVQTMRVGPSRILKIPQKENSDIETKFEFVSPSPDLMGTLEVARTQLANYLSSKGLDTSIIADKPETNTYNSGIERMLALIEKFEVTRDDFNLYQNVEQDIYKIVKRWHNVLRDTDQLDDKYKTAELPEDSEVIVEFARPEMIKTDAEKLEVFAKKEELGLMSSVMYVMEEKGMSEEEALEHLEKVRTHQQVRPIQAPPVEEVDSEEVDSEE